MNVILTAILAVQMLTALAMIGLILIQHGKGADMGAAFGSGSSGSLFGASGSANFLSRTTAVLAAVFFACTLMLAYFGNLRPVESGSVLDRAATRQRHRRRPLRRRPRAPQPRSRARLHRPRPLPQQCPPRQQLLERGRFPSSDPKISLFLTGATGFHLRVNSKAARKANVTRFLRPVRARNPAVVVKLVDTLS